ncbi:MAG: hypothetical protein NZ480_04410 [Bdellovibrionaceae bacterium]|nr:hypothetical protein [Pseudobdellovibrionaceae bacterium]MDW8190014.1 hypothetical protein [Pseudobdellovibrionaceae bacterium]
MLLFCLNRIVPLLGKRLGMVLMGLTLVVGQSVRGAVIKEENKEVIKDEFKEDIRQVPITIGREHWVALKGPHQVQLGKEFRYQSRPDGLVVTALKPGYGIVKNAQTVVGIHALTQKKWSTFYRLRKHLAHQPSMEVTLDRGEVVLGGKIFGYHQLDLLVQACKERACDYINELNVADHQKAYLLKKIWQVSAPILEELPDFSFGPPWTVRCGGSQCDSHLAQRFSPWGVRWIVDDKGSGMKASVRVQLLLVELRRHYFEQLGLRPPTELSAQILPNFVLDPANIQASFFAQKGWGRTIASPSLLVRSGGTAEFRAGGEVPFRQMNFRMTTVTWKPYGVYLKIKAQSQGSERVQLELDCEVSTIDGSVQVDGVPGFKVHRLNTSFDLLKKQTVILSGLIQAEQTQSGQGLKGLLGLPILGSLFSSQEFRNKESEFVIFLKPDILGAYP